MRSAQLLRAGAAAHRADAASGRAPRPSGMPALSRRGGCADHGGASAPADRRAASGRRASACEQARRTIAPARHGLCACLAAAGHRAAAADHAVGGAAKPPFAQLPPLVERIVRGAQDYVIVQLRARARRPALDRGRRSALAAAATNCSRPAIGLDAARSARVPISAAPA